MIPVGPPNLFLRWVQICPAPTLLLSCRSPFQHSLLSSVLLRFHLTPPLCSAVASEKPCLCLGCLQIQFTSNQCREAWFCSHNIHFTLFISEAACIRSDKAWDMPLTGKNVSRVRRVTISTTFVRCFFLIFPPICNFSSGANTCPHCRCSTKSLFFLHPLNRVRFRMMYSVT